MAHTLQFLGQLAHTLARPAQRRFRISSRDRLHQPLQVRAELGVFAHVAFASPSFATDSPLLRLDSPLQFLDPIADHLSRQLGRSGHDRNPSPTERQRFVSSERTARPLREFSGYPQVALLDFLFLCHASQSIISSLILQSLFPDDSFGGGSTLPVFDTPIGRLGAVICWENYMPLLRMTMYRKGIQLYCAPTADGRDEWIASMQHIALEGRCFVLSCNQFARRSDYPASYVTPFGDAPETVLSRGGSCIVNPLGQMLAGPNFSEEDIMTADLDLGDIARGKYDFDVVGHYARPDIFSLHVNEHPQSPVIRN